MFSPIEGKMDHTSKNQIMIAGGDSHFSYLMQRYVRRSAFKIIPVNFGEDLLSLARSKKPAAIVLEIDQPETIGWQILRMLKSDSVVGQIPVIVCSWQEEEARALADGADTYLRMPILYADFETALESIAIKE